MAVSGTLIRLAALFLLCANAAQAGEDVFPLHHGLNLSSWLANAPRQPLYARDFALIKEAGFDHVRLPVNPEQFGFSLAPDREGAPDDGFLPVDKAISMAIEAGLPVLFDMHPSESFTQTVQDNSLAERNFIHLWAALARRYKSTPPSALAFELLNEPPYYNHAEQYNALVRKLVAAIRSQNPTRLIIVGVPGDGLQALHPLQDPYVFYDFHFYEPYLITHQGRAGFAGQMLRYFSHVPYPANLAVRSAMLYAPAAPDPGKAQQELDAYIKAGWNAERIQSRIADAARWAAENHARLLCGEFGVIRANSDPDSRYRWISDVRKALEHSGIGWDLWDYTDIFGITVLSGETVTDPVDSSVRFVHPEKSSRHFEPQALTALGLTP